MIKRVLVEFERTLFLPRFTMAKGERWQVRVDNLQRDGFSCGGGFVSNDEYKVIHEDS